MTENLRPIPEGSGEKRYTVVCHTKEGWENIHQLLCDDNTEEDSVPSHSCECCDDSKMIDNMGTYMLTDAEVEILKNHPQVAGINIDTSYYDDGTEIKPASKTYRYDSTTVKHQRDLDYNSGVLDNSTSAYNGRVGAQFLRHQSRVDDIWDSDVTTIVDQNPQYNGDGSDVDLIITDGSAWFGHTEFINTSGIGSSLLPKNFVGGNVLDSSGKCGVLDLYLDAPYYIDPDFFDADQANRTEVRWDGTRVPTDTAAKNWWENNTTTYRSAKYASGGTNDFGTITTSVSAPTRSAYNGSDTVGQTTGSSTHGSSSMSVAYGKTQGWAFNSNKWFITYNVGREQLMKIIKVFHENKPNNSSYGAKDPTLVSQSWQSIQSFSNSGGSSPGYYYHRTLGDGTGSVSYSYNTSSKPKPLQRITRYESDYAGVYVKTHSIMVAAKAAVDAGVIFCNSAGNDNQKMVNSDHPDYNNYHSTNSSTTLAQALVPDVSGRIKFSNRRGYPAQSGQYTDGSVEVYPVIMVGALDPIRGSNGLERKINYSTSGESVDVYCITECMGADDYRGYVAGEVRYDSYYTIPGNSQSLESRDYIYGGTSCACPVFAGLLATKLQHNRSWTWQDVKAWLKNDIGQASSSNFYVGTEPTTINDTNWDDDDSLAGGTPIISFDNSIDNLFKFTGSNISISGNVNFSLT